MKDHWNVVKAGERFIRLHDSVEVRVMGVVDRYAVVRIKGCMPFLVRSRDLRHGVYWKNAEENKG